MREQEKWSTQLVWFFEAFQLHWLQFHWQRMAVVFQAVHCHWQRIRWTSGGANQKYSKCYIRFTSWIATFTISCAYTQVNWVYLPFADIPKALMQRRVLWVLETGKVRKCGTGAVGGIQTSVAKAGSFIGDSLSKAWQDLLQKRSTFPVLSSLAKPNDDGFMHTSQRFAQYQQCCCAGHFRS